MTSLKKQAAAVETDVAMTAKLHRDLAPRGLRDMKPWLRLKHLPREVLLNRRDLEGLRDMKPWLRLKHLPREVLLNRRDLALRGLGDMWPWLRLRHLPREVLEERRDLAPRGLQGMTVLARIHTWLSQFWIEAAPVVAMPKLLRMLLLSR